MTVSTARTTRAAGAGEIAIAAGYLHEIGFYASDEEFRELICPFALGGLEAGEPVVFAYDRYKTDLLQRWLPDDPSVTYITDTGPYTTPAKALVGWRRLIGCHLATGAPRVRIAGNVPHPGYGIPYVGWDRYEAAVDRALGDLPVWAPCLYDTRIASAEVLQAASRRHHRLLDRSGDHRANGSFESVRRLADFLAPPIDPLEETVPAFELLDPTPANVRAAVRLAAGLGGFDRPDDLVIAVSEIVSNAILHGLPPVGVRIWLGEGRIVITVHDAGNGPADPLAGLLPSRDEYAASGRGLWLAHQLDVDVALIAANDGFTVRVRAEGRLGT